MSQVNKTIAANIEKEARYSQGLFIWTDCDREGEHIGSEVRDAALKGNSRLDIKRAKFSTIERACVTFLLLRGKFLTCFRHVIHAATHPVRLDERQVNAVAARIELDLRIGFALSRLQTNTLQTLGGPLSSATLSYGL